MQLLTCAQHPVDFQQILAAFTNRGARTSWANSRSPSVKAVPSRPRCFPIGNIEIKSPGVDRKSTRSGALRVAAQHLDSSDVAPSQYFHARDKWPSYRERKELPFPPTLVRVAAVVLPRIETPTRSPNDRLFVENYYSPGATEQQCDLRNAASAWPGDDWTHAVSRQIPTTQTTITRRKSRMSAPPGALPRAGTTPPCAHPQDPHPLPGTSLPGDITG